MEIYYIIGKSSLYFILDRQLILIHFFIKSGKLLKREFVGENSLEFCNVTTTLKVHCGFFVCAFCLLVVKVKVLFLPFLISHKYKKMF